MNDTLRDMFIQITNTNFPSLQQIEDNLFVALERYQLINKTKTQSAESKGSRIGDKVKTSSYAVRIQNDRRSLHEIKNKSKESSLVGSKVDSQKLCTLCSCNHKFFRRDK